MVSPLLKFVEKICTQTAVYWGNPKPNGFGGYTYDSPVEIKCRWEGKSKLIRDDKGNEVVSKAEILVTQDLDIGGMIKLGTLADLSPSQLPEDEPDAYKILQVEKIPLFRSPDEFIRRVYI